MGNYASMVVELVLLFLGNGSDSRSASVPTLPGHPRLKNPFYELDMRWPQLRVHHMPWSIYSKFVCCLPRAISHRPIRFELFEKEVQRVLAEFPRRHAWHARVHFMILALIQYCMMLH